VRVGVLFLCLLVSCAGSPKPREVEAPPPNILFVFTDDHASHAIGAYGSRFPGDNTPNLDQLAAEGMRFSRCAVTNSICAPSRAVILTGKHSHLNGVLTNAERFDGAQMTFPKLLQEQGYQTALFGKWHLKSEPTGFDHYERLIGQGPYYNPKMRFPADSEKGFDERLHEGYTSDIITDLAIDWLRDRPAEAAPFMLMVQHKAPHRHWQPAPRHLDLFAEIDIEEPDNLFDDYSTRTTAAFIQDMEIATTLTPHDLKLAPQRRFTEEQQKAWDAAYGPRNAEFTESRDGMTEQEIVRWKYQRYLKDYLRCIRAVDENIGRLLVTLEELDLTRETIVIYSSDQGFFLGEHGWFDKRFMYEECYRTPLIVRWPGVTKAGQVNDQLVSNLDYAQTFLDLAGVAMDRPEVEAMQGISLKPLLEGKKVPFRQSHYYQYYEYHGDRTTAHMVRRHRGVATDRYKLIHFYNLDEWELYDLETDPHEMKNRAGDPNLADVRRELEAELERLAREYGIPDDRGSVPRDPHGRIDALKAPLQSPAD
jgi:arylsulfatase A-like enzyme